MSENNSAAFHMNEIARKAMNTIPTPYPNINQQ